MKEFTSQEFVDWTGGREYETENNIGIQFVLVKTSSCAKCASLISKAEEVFKKFEENIAIFTFSNGPAAKIVTDIFNELGVASVPQIITRFKTKDGLLKLGVIKVDVEDNFINLQNIFDAFGDNDQLFFGFNEYDEPVEKNPDYMCNRILRTIYGEADLSEHDTFVKNLELNKKGGCETCRI